MLINHLDVFYDTRLNIVGKHKLVQGGGGGGGALVTFPYAPKVQARPRGDQSPV